MSELKTDERERALAKLRWRVELKKLELEAARLLSEISDKRADTGWFLSMMHLEAGTLLAVLEGNTATEKMREVSRIEEELIELVAAERAMSQR